jgi:hypothetical protein
VVDIVGVRLGIKGETRGKLVTLELRVEDLVEVALCVADGLTDEDLVEVALRVSDELAVEVLVAEELRVSDELAVVVLVADADAVALVEFKGWADASAKSRKAMARIFGWIARETITQFL